MKFRFSEEYTLITKLSVAEVITRISENIEPAKTFRTAIFRKKTTKLYEGEISYQSFAINRIIYNRNSFAPLIKGEVTKTINGTEITIKMRPTMPVLIFMAIWLGAVAAACIFILIAVGVGATGLSLVFLIPFVMLIFGNFLMTTGFTAECRNSKSFLKGLLEARESLNITHFS